MEKYTLPWLRRRRKTAPELPLKPPIHLSPFSNGEVFFQPGPAEAKIRRLILEKAEEGARRHGIDRREFLASSMGMATSLWAVNLVTGCSDAGSPRNVQTARAVEPMPRPIESVPAMPSGSTGMSGLPAVPRDAGAAGARPTGTSMGGAGSGAAGSGGADGSGARGDSATQTPLGPGGSFQVPDDPTDPEQVCALMLDPSKEFIFDIQTHHVNRADTFYEGFLRDQEQFRGYCSPSGLSSLECFGRNEYVRLMFLESDTTVAVLSGLPAATESDNPITNDEIAQSREAINLLADGTQRLVNHHMVLPNQRGISADAVQAELDEMARVLDTFGNIGAWKCYPAWSPANTESSATDGWNMDDAETGLRFVEQGIALGVPLFCIHKGLPIPAFSTQHLDPADVGRIARTFPEADFVVYHSGYGNQNSYFESAYAAGNRNGVDSLITSLLDAGVGPNENVYAELGTTWQLISTNPLIGGPTAAAHVLGKLLTYVGEDNVVWGTDSIWYGSPQSQIESFLQFQISPEFQALYGYPELTLAIKRKILGLNAARIYGIDPEAMRCGIEASELHGLKLQLDHAYGKRRWAFHEPMLTRPEDYWRLLRQSGFRPG